MMQSRSTVILVVTLVAIFVVAASPRGVSGLSAKFRKMFERESRHGSSRQFILQVQVQDAVKAEAEQVMHGLRASMATRGVTYTSVERTNPQTSAESDDLRIVVKGVAADDAGGLAEIIAQSFSLRQVGTGNAPDVVLQFQDSRLSAVKLRAVQHSLDVVERSLKAQGLEDVTVRLYGPADSRSQLLVQAPDGHDPELVRAAVASAVAGVRFGAFRGSSGGSTEYPERISSVSGVHFRFGILTPVSELSHADGVNEGVPDRTDVLLTHPVDGNQSGSAGRRQGGDTRQGERDSLRLSSSRKRFVFSEFRGFGVSGLSSWQGAIPSSGDMSDNRMHGDDKRVPVASWGLRTPDIDQFFVTKMPFWERNNSVMISRGRSFPDTINKSVNRTLCRETPEPGLTEREFAAIAT